MKSLFFCKKSDKSAKSQEPTHQSDTPKLAPDIDSKEHAPHPQAENFAASMSFTLQSLYITSSIFTTSFLSMESSGGTTSVASMLKLFEQSNIHTEHKEYIKTGIIILKGLYSESPSVPERFLTAANNITWLARDQMSAKVLSDVLSEKFKEYIFSGNNSISKIWSQRVKTEENAKKLACETVSFIAQKIASEQIKAKSLINLSSEEAADSILEDFRQLEGIDEIYFYFKDSRFEGWKSIDIDSVDHSNTNLMKSSELPIFMMEDDPYMTFSGVVDENDDFGDAS